jgi:hypothetical protein
VKTTFDPDRDDDPVGWEGPVRSLRDLAEDWAGAAEQERWDDEHEERPRGEELA